MTYRHSRGRSKHIKRCAMDSGPSDNPFMARKTKTLIPKKYSIRVSLRCTLIYALCRCQFSSQYLGELHLTHDHDSSRGPQTACFHKRSIHPKAHNTHSKLHEARISGHGSDGSRPCLEIRYGKHDKRERKTTTAISRRDTKKAANRRQIKERDNKQNNWRSRKACKKTSQKRRNGRRAKASK